MLNKAPRLTGEDSDDPEERLIFCQNACRVVQGPREAQIECTILTLRGYAPCMWTTAMKGADYTSPIVFTVLRNHLHGLAGEQLRMSEFRMLRFDDSMRGTTLEAFKPLIAKAQRLQRRLSVEMQCEEVLVTTLQGSSNMIVLGIQRTERPTNSLQLFVQHCRLEIMNVPAAEKANATFFATIKYSKRMNRKGRDGKTLRYLKYNSLYHLFRECRKVDEAGDISFVEMFTAAEVVTQGSGAQTKSDTE